MTCCANPGAGFDSNPGKQQIPRTFAKLTFSGNPYCQLAFGEDGSSKILIIRILCKTMGLPARGIALGEGFQGGAQIIRLQGFYKVIDSAKFSGQLAICFLVGTA